jgi:hypothetical protein
MTWTPEQCLAKLRIQESQRIDRLVSLVSESTGLIRDLASVIVGFDFIRESEHVIVFHGSDRIWKICPVLRVDPVSDEAFLQVSGMKLTCMAWVWWIQPLSTLSAVPTHEWFSKRPIALHITGHCSLFHQVVCRASVERRNWHQSHDEFAKAHDPFLKAWNKGCSH